MSSVLLIDADGELWYTRQEELGVECISMPGVPKFAIGIDK